MSISTIVLVVAVATGAASAAGAWRPLDAAAFFVTPGEPAVLRWQAEGPPAATQKADPPQYVVRDYAGRQVAAGKAEPADGGGIQVRLTLPQGYFDIELADTGQRFGIAALPAAAPGSRDEFFCIDTAMSWLVRDDALREALVKDLARCGIAQARERLTWGAVSPAPGRFEWQTPARFDAIRQLYRRHGVPVLEMCHDGPAWMGLVGRYPADLVAAAASWEQIARRWKGAWGALEVWNEPDIFFGANLPADQYAPIVRAMAWAARRAEMDLPLVAGVMAHCNDRFLDSAAGCGVLDSCDAFSFHTYGRAAEMEGLIGRYRRWLRAAGRETMPLWITECGRPWKKGTDRPPADQDAFSAADITMKAVESRACGIARYFAFVYPYYEENQNNFGMMGREGTPLRCMAAYARCAAVLAGKRYLGDLRCQGIDRARVFGDDGEAVAVLYRAVADPAASAKLPVPILRVEGIDGRKLEAGEGSTVPLPDGLAYAWLDRTRLGEALNAETPARRLWRAAQGPAPRRPAASPIILRYAFDPAVVQPLSEGYRLKAAAPDKLPLAIRAFNLSDQAVKLTVAASFDPNAARAIGQAAQPLAIPASGSTDAAWELDMTKAFAQTGRLRVMLAAREAGAAGPAAILAIDLFGEPKLEHALAGHARRTRLAADDLKSWTANIVGHGKMTMARTEQGAWRLEAQFGQGDRWVYPYLRLPDGVSFAGRTGLVIRARCEQPAEVRILVWEAETGTAYLTGRAIIPADGQWHAAMVRFDDLTLSTANAPDANGKLDLKDVRRISIGLNSNAPGNALEVSDLYLVGP